MPTSEARILANQQNALRSTGPKTAEGKENSRRNALKHGMTGEGIVVPVEDEAEVEARTEAFLDELQPTGALGVTLVRRAARLAVRMERCAERELAAISERVVQALADFEAPEDLDDAEIARMRVETARMAAFDTSKEACLARRYEAAAERGFYRALKEFRQVEKEAKQNQGSPEINEALQPLGSFLPAAKTTPTPAQEPLRQPIRATLPAPSTCWNPGEPLCNPAFGAACDVPISIGKRR
jgi:hypothetical protein